MRKVLCILIAFLGVLTCSCQKSDSASAGLVLSSDKESIMADGSDQVRFTVKYNGEDVSDECTITLKGKGGIEGTVFSTFSSGTLEFTAMYNGETSNALKIESKAPEGLFLVSDRQEIEGNGVDACTFTVYFKGKDMTAKAEISDKDGNVVENPFKSIAVGRHEFTAEYAGNTSNVCAVEVVTPKLSITSDKQVIQPNGKDAARFTVSLDGNDVTSSSKIFVNDSPVEDNTLVSSKEGKYEVYAVYEGMTSNHIIIESAFFRIVPDRQSVPAKAGEKVSLKVMAGDMNVSSKAKIFYTRDMKELPLVGDTFTFTTTDSYVDEFKAVYDGKEKFIRIGKEPLSAFNKKVAMIKSTGTWCSWCHKPGLILEEMLEGELKGKAEMISPHGRDIMETQDALDYIKFLNIQKSGSDVTLSYPLVSFDYRSYIYGGSLEDFQNMAENALSVPAKCGIQVSSSSDGDELVVDVMVWTVFDGEYYVSAALLENGIVADQASKEEGTVKDFVHNNVVRYMDSPDFGNPWGHIAQYDQKSGQFRFPANNYDLSKCDVMVIVSAKEGKDIFATNTVKLKAGSSVDFSFEK